MGWESDVGGWVLWSEVKKHMCVVDGPYIHGSPSTLDPQVATSRSPRLLELFPSSVASRSRPTGGVLDQPTAYLLPCPPSSPAPLVASSRDEVAIVTVLKHCLITGSATRGDGSRRSSIQDGERCSPHEARTVAIAVVLCEPAGFGGHGDNSRGAKGGGDIASLEDVTKPTLYTVCPPTDQVASAAAQRLPSRRCQVLSKS